MDSNQERPKQLTNQFLKMIFQGPGDHTGYFQIIQFHKKRSKFYSAYIADGYYKCKVIFRKQASLQIDLGEIKLFSIVYGTVSNQGNGLSIFNKLKVWAYPRTVGIIRPWKFQSPNNYLNGNNYITWHDAQSQSAQQFRLDYKQDNQDQEVSVTSYCASEIKSKSKFPVHKKQLNDFINQLSEKNQKSQTKLINNMQTAFSFAQTADLNIKDTSNQKQIIDLTNSQLQKIGSTQSLGALNRVSNDKHKQKQLNKSSSTCLQNNQKVDLNKGKRQLLLTESQNSQNSQVNSNKIKTKIQEKVKNDQDGIKIVSIDERLSQNLSNCQVSAVQKRSRLSLEAVSLDQGQDTNQNVIFNFQKNYSYAKLIESQQDEDNYFNQILMLNYKKFEKAIEDQQIQSMIESKKKRDSIKMSQIKTASQTKMKNKNEKSVFQFLVDNNQNEQEQTNKISKKLQESLCTPVKCTAQQIACISMPSKPDQISQQQLQTMLQRSQSKSRSMFSISQQLTISQLICHYDYSHSGSNNWLTIRILCFKNLPIKGNVLAVIEQVTKSINSSDNLKVSKQSYGHIANFIVTNADFYNPFQEGQTYQLSLNGIKVVEPQVQQLFVGVELRANSQQIFAKLKNKEQLSCKPLKANSHFCYISIERIERQRQGLSVNIVGVVQRFKNIAKRKGGLGWINIFTLVDPFTGALVDFTIFDAHKLIFEPGSSVVIYNAIIRIYQERKTLSVGPYTFYYFGQQQIQRFYPYIPQLHQIKQWKETGNKVHSIQSKKQNIIQINELIQIQNFSNGSQKILTSICRITKVSPFFSKYLCERCNKKLSPASGSSFICPSCGRCQNPFIQLHLNLQISDNTHSCYVEFGHFQSMEYIGENGQKIKQFIQDYMHKRVKMVLNVNGKYKPNVVKMEVMTQDHDLLNRQLSQLREIVRYV